MKGHLGFVGIGDAPNGEFEDSHALVRAALEDGSEALAPDGLVWLGRLVVPAVTESAEEYEAFFCFVVESIGLKGKGQFR